MESAAALGRCTSLRSLYLRGVYAPNRRLITATIAAALVPPGLAHLHIHGAGMEPAATTAILLLAAAAVPQTLRSLTLISCNGDVAAAGVAAVSVRSWRRLTVVKHREPQQVSYLDDLDATVRERWAHQVALFAGRRPDVVFSGELWTPRRHGVRTRASGGAMEAPSRAGAGGGRR